MLQIDIMSRTPVYEQIISQVEMLVAAGVMKPGEQLPSVRSLSMQISVNPNTIQKAYAELTGRGITAAVPGRGCFVSPDAAEVLLSRGKNALGELSELCKKLYSMGVSLEELHRCVDSAAKDSGKE